MNYIHIILYSLSVALWHIQTPVLHCMARPYSALDVRGMGSGYVRLGPCSYVMHKTQ